MNKDSEVRSQSAPGGSDGTGEGFVGLASYQSIIALALVLFGLYLTSLYNYLLFHSLTEIFSVVVACAMFILVWNCRRFIENNYLLFVGIAYLSVAVLDLLHTLAYKGMNVFPGAGTNLPTQLWVAARYVESLTLLAAPFLIHRRLSARLVLIGYGVVTVLLIGVIYVWPVFPVCHVEGVGLTIFKKVSEYVICLVLAASMVLLLRSRREFDEHVLRLLALSILATIVSELAFTMYIDVYGLPNLIGHLLKLISFYLIYKAIVQTGLVQPYDLLFRDLKQSEVRQKAERERLFAVLDMLPALVYLQAPDHSVRFANRAFREAFGEPGTRPCHEILHGRQTPCQPCPTFEVFETRKPQVWEWTSPGRRTYVLYDNLFTDTDGSPLVLELAIDITERKQAEEALRAAHHFQGRILSTAATAIFTVDPQQRIASVNEEFCAITGFPKEEVVGQHCTILRGDPCTRHCGLFDPNRVELLSKKQCSIRAKDGRKLTIIKNADLIRNGSGEITGGIESFVDVTSLAEAREAAEAASRAKSAFLANMSHELRTPLTAILGFSDVLGREVCGPLNEEQKTSIDAIQKSGQHLMALISDLLDLAKVEVGKVELDLEPVSLDSIIEWSLLLVREKADAYGIELKAQVPASLPLVMANERAVRQILLNLLTNAVKFSSGGGQVTVRARCDCFGVAVDVVDTGIGIAPDELEKIFDPFERSGRREARSVEGTGLGLPLARGLLKVMGGTITVQSELGKGSCFTFTLPAVDATTPASSPTASDTHVAI